MTRSISPLPVLITRLSNTNALGFLGLQTDSFCWPNILCSAPLMRPLKGRFKDTHSCDFSNDVTVKYQQNLFNFSVSVKSSSLQSFQFYLTPFTEVSWKVVVVAIVAFNNLISLFPLFPSLSSLTLSPLFPSFSLQSDVLKCFLR